VCIKQTILLLTILFLLSACASARLTVSPSSPTTASSLPTQAILVTPSPSTPTPTLAHSARWRQDLRYLAEELPGRHPNLFFQTSREEFEQAVTELDAAIPSLRDEEIMVGMMHILAMLGDAHTFLGVRSLFHTYPIQLYSFSDGIYVTHATPEYRRALGTELVQIGSTDISTVSTAVGSVISHENDAWLLFQIPRYIIFSEVLYALGIASDIEHAEFVFEEADGTRFTLDLGSLPPDSDGTLNEGWLQAPDPDEATLPLYLRDRSLFYWYDYIEDPQTIYVRYSHCENMPDQSFRKFANELFAFTDAHPVAKFVVDLRDNTGGSSDTLDPLIRGLRVRPEISQQPRQLFAIIGRGTFSAALWGVVDLTHNFPTLLVGEPTGGKPNSYGYNNTLRLPHSNLLVVYSTEFNQLLEDDPPSLIPDIPVTVSSDDHFSGQDPVLEAILTYHNE
jgi:hypothetical protein